MNSRKYKIQPDYSKIRKFRLRIQDSEFRIQNSELGTQHVESRTYNSELKTQNSELRIKLPFEVNFQSPKCVSFKFWTR